MLLGDSITAGIIGSNPVAGYRDDLDSKLIEVDAIFDFVGTLNDGVGFDADHEGHGGWTVDRVLADIDSFLYQTGPEIVLVHLGTNDISTDQGIPGTLAELDSLLTVIFNYNVNVVVYLSGLIPRNDSRDSLTTVLNEGILWIVDDWSTSGYSVKFIDHNSAFKANPNWQTEYLFDHVHPTNAGYAVIAGSYFDSLVTEDIYGEGPLDSPAPITDLSVNSLNSRTALLGWTATGNIDTIGVADRYDVRYSTSPITESNFSSAAQAVGEPDPSPYGSTEEFTSGGLDPGTFYYFAVKAIGTTGNPSPISNVPIGETIEYPVAMDDFERADLGPDWVAETSMIIDDGELANTSSVESWDYAVFSPVTDLEYASLSWGDGVDSLGIGGGGLALMLNSTSLDEADGYFIFRHRVFNYYAIWTVVDGEPDLAVAQSPVSTLPFPLAGDIFEAVLSSDIHGHHFDCYINGVYDTRVSDPGKLQGNGTTLWSGVMLLGNRNNNVEDFQVAGPNAGMAPGMFSLLTPSDGDTVHTGRPFLDWEDSVDPNPSDSVLYTLYYGLSSIFSPESTVVIDDLTKSHYTIPSNILLSLSVDEGDPSIEPIDNAVFRQTASGLLPVVAVGTGPQLTDLPDSVVIYWKVKARDPGGLETMSLQTDWGFAVIISEYPFTIHPLTPKNGGHVDARALVLSWEPSRDRAPDIILYYTVYYDTDPSLAKPTVIDSIENTACTLPPLKDNKIYYWRVEGIDSEGRITQQSAIWSFLVLSNEDILITGAGSSPILPKVFALGQNFPNPFNPSTSIRYDIPAGLEEEGIEVLVQIFNSRGQLVKTLENGVRRPGSYQVHWDGKDEKGARVGSGLYLYRIVAGSFRDIKKMTIAK